MTDALCHLVADGNDVVEMKLVRTRDDIENGTIAFSPEMCHQVFGEKENIFGYNDLRIKLYYSAGSLLTYLGIEYSDMIDPRKYQGLKADDIEGPLKKILAPGYLTNLDQFVSKLGKENKFVPHGRLIYSFTFTPEDGGAKRTFEVFYNETSTPGFLTYHERLQTFLLWYVDAASFIDVDDDQWSFFTVNALQLLPVLCYQSQGTQRKSIGHSLLTDGVCEALPNNWPVMLSFEKYSSSSGSKRYACAGYATVYRYYAYPKNIRPRISQVIVFPPFRKLGICAHLLEAIYTHFIAMPEVIDITVEDPSPDFQRIRDYVDAKNCEDLPAFQPEKLTSRYCAELATQARNKFKINRSQARRVYEILRLKNTNTSDKNAYQKYRLVVKNRLNAPYQKKKLEMKKLQKVLKPEEFAAAASSSGLHETYDRLNGQYTALEEEYRRVIRRLERDAKK